MTIEEALDWTDERQAYLIQFLRDHHGPSFERRMSEALSELVAEIESLRAELNLARSGFTR